MSLWVFFVLGLKILRADVRIAARVLRVVFLITLIAVTVFLWWVNVHMLVEDYQ